MTQPAPGPAPAPPQPVVLPPVLIVSGTGTEVGKTVVTAAIAALAASRGRRVAVVKPAQTGEPVSCWSPTPSAASTRPRTAALSSSRATLTVMSGLDSTWESSGS